jgi:hypothetical protein
MTKERDISRATQFLNDHPEIRQRVRETDEFRMWNENLPNVLIDGTKIYISEGDIQKEEDDLIIDFAIKKNLISVEEFEK